MTYTMTDSVPIAASAVSIVYELLCVMLTLIKTFDTYRRGRKVGMRAPLARLLLRDGMLTL